MTKAENLTALFKQSTNENFHSKVATDTPSENSLYPEQNIYSDAIIRGFSLLNVANAIHSWHFKCKNLNIPNRWNVHKALNDLYDSLRDLADELIESSTTHLPEDYLPKMDQKFFLEVSGEFELEECIIKLRKMRDEYNEEGKAASDDIALQDIYVKLVQTVNKCLYQIA